MNSDIYGATPGLGATRTANHRLILLGAGQYLPGNHVIAGADARDPLNSPVTEIRAGLLLGEVTASNKLGASIIGVTTNAETASSTAIEVAPAVAAELVRRQGASGTFNLTGPPTAGGTVITEEVTYSAVNTETGVITCSATTAAFVAGSFVQPTDGSQTIRTFIPEGYPIKVIDVNEVDRDVQLERYPIAGLIDSSQLLNWPSDVALRQWIVDALNAVGHFTFDHKHGL